MKKKKIIEGTHNYSEAESYVYPEEAAVQEHLEWFRGLKLGLMMHWAPYSQLGLMASWPLIDSESAWSQYQIDWTDDMEEFKEQYWNLNKTFNPIRFRPDRWAALAKECGFKYLTFTTKHHDGFCMFDTKTTNYKITDPQCPFSRHKYANVTKELFDAFRKEGLAISAYFSKPDWHSDAFWHRAFGITPSNANCNYSVEEHPKLWEEFVQYTHQQLLELTSDYGKIDVLWLDGGGVSPHNRKQDIRLGEVVNKIRATTQPHLIVCDRTVGGAYENFITPEQCIPPEPLNVPWEANMTLGRSYSYFYDDELKSVREIVNMLIEIVSKGGNLALNITPRPDGGISDEAVYTLRKLGRWLSKNGEGIYETTISECVPKRYVRYTRKGNTEYAFYMYRDAPLLEQRVVLEITGRIDSVRLLRTGEQVPFSYVNDGIVLYTSELDRSDMEYADCFEVVRKEEEM